MNPIEAQSHAPCNINKTNKRRSFCSHLFPTSTRRHHTSTLHPPPMSTQEAAACWRRHAVFWACPMCPAHRWSRETGTPSDASRSMRIQVDELLRLFCWFLKGTKGTPTILWGSTKKDTHVSVAQSISSWFRNVDLSSGSFGQLRFALRGRSVKQSFGASKTFACSSWHE